ERRGRRRGGEHAAAVQYQREHRQRGERDRLAARLRQWLLAGGGECDAAAISRQHAASPQARRPGGLRAGRSAVPCHGDRGVAERRRYAARAAVRRDCAQGRARREAACRGKPGDRAAAARAWRYQLPGAPHGGTGLSADSARAGAGAGESLRRYRGAVPGARRRVVEPRYPAGNERLTRVPRPPAPAPSVTEAPWRWAISRTMASPRPAPGPGVPLTR